MSVKVMVSFPAKFLAEIDEVALDEHRSRSELLREAARFYIEIRHRRRPGDEPRVRSAIAIQDTLARLSHGTGEDSAADVRRWREAR